MITSSPGPTPAIRMQRCRPAVPDETAAQCGAPTASASSDSKRGPVGPSERCPERSTSSTSSSSRSSIQGAESAIAARRRCSRAAVLERRQAHARRASCSARARATAPSGRSRRAPCRGTPSAAARVIVADADLVVVDRPHRRHLGGGAAHEHLVGEVEVGADQRLLEHRVAEVGRDLDDRVARDPVQDPGREVGRVDDAVARRRRSSRRGRRRRCPRASAGSPRRSRRFCASVTASIELR